LPTGGVPGVSIEGPEVDMAPRIVRPLVALAVLGLGSGAPPASAGEPADPAARTPDAWRVHVPRWKRLRARPELTLYARTAREAGTDPYPFVLAATREQRAQEVGIAVLPGTIGRFVTRESLADAGGAAEAVRFFVHGREVRDAAALARVVEAARRVAEAMPVTHVRVLLAGDPGALFAAPRVSAEGGVHVVRLVVVQTDVVVRVIEAVGRVDATAGAVTVEERLLVSGPPVAALLCATGETPESLARLESEHAARVGTVRRALLSALDPRRTREAVRALAKPGVTMERVRAALGEPDDDVGSGIHVWVYALEEGAARVGEAGAVHYVDLVSSVPGSPFAGPASEDRLFPAGR
jgi:hypothetical protein